MSTQLLNRNLRIFISSTFRDMQQEREELIKHVFPKIKKIARERFVEITEVDLRWGVTEEQAQSGEALKICLDEINKCKESPIFFIGILGHRYGWIPNQTDQSLLENEKYKWIKDYQQKSVTELEIIHGVLNEKDPNKISYFYFRDKQLSKEIESKLEQEDANYKSDTNAPEAKLLEEKQTSLKASIKEKRGVSIDGYTSIQEFGKRVEEDLLHELDRLFPADKVPNETEKTKIRHAQFAQSRKFYISDTKADAELDSFIDSNASYCLIHAASGMGKSAFIAHTFKRYQSLKPDTHMLEHYIGGGDSSTDIKSVLFRVLGELKEAFQIQEDLPSAQKIEEEFALWLYKIPKKREIIIFIDALNQLNDEKAKKLFWLPAKLPSNLKIILSSIDPLEKENAQILSLSHLNQERQKSFIQQYLQKAGKTLDQGQTQILLDSPLTSNPLYLKIVLDELKVFGIYEEVTTKITTLLANQTIDDLLENVLDRIEQEYDVNNTLQTILSLIYASRDGMGEEELLEIINDTTIDKLQEKAASLKLTRQDLSHMLLALEEHIITKDGLLNFFHAFMEKAVEDKYALRQEEHITRFQKTIADYFEANKEDKEIRRVARELPYQLFHLNDEERLLKTISDYGIFDFLDEDDWKLEIHSYYLSIKTIQDKEERFYEGLLEITRATQDEEILGYLCNEIATYFHSYISYAKAQLLQQQALELRKRVLGEEHLITLISINNLAALYRSQGEYAKAQPLYEQALELRKKVLGEEHPDTLMSMNNVAALHQVQGEYAKAQPLYEQALELSNKILGEEHPSTISFMNNLAGLYKSIGEYVKALPLQQQALELRKKVLGKEHPDTLGSINNLAMLYYQQNKKSEALKAFEEAYETSLRVLGESHPTAQQLKENYLYVKEELGGNSSLCEVGSEADEPLETLLCLAKGLTMHSNDNEITLIHLFNSLRLVELNQTAQMIFREVFGDQIDSSEKLSFGNLLIDMAKASPAIPYDENLKGLVKQLKEVFGDEPMCKLRD